MQEWLNRSATELCDSLKRREISAIELLEINLEQARRVTTIVNPLAVLLEEQARADAALADQALAAGQGGRLCGLPITVKDSQWLAGVPCANGSLSLQHFVPDQTCAAILRLRSEGAVVFAKTTCPELCVSGTNNSAIYGATLNPWNLSRTPGGSSGGAAAALASGVGSLSLGSDGGGSIRIPAAFCGLVGFKPSHGVVPRAPGFPTWDSLVAYGPMTRSVADAALMFDVLAADSIQLAKPSPKKRGDQLPLVISEDLGFAPLDDDVRRCFRATMDRVRAAGIPLREDDPGLTSSVVTWATLATHDMWSHKRPGEPDLAAGTNHKYEDFGPYAQEFMRFGSQFSTDQVAVAQTHVRQVLDAYITMFRRNQATILITPTLGCEAFEKHRTHPRHVGERSIRLPWLDWAGFLYDANLAGMPACTIPMGLGDDGLPLGLQILGLPGSDLDVLATARQLEALTGWSSRLAPGMADSMNIVGSEIATPLPPVSSLHATGFDAAVDTAIAPGQPAGFPPIH